VTHVVISQKCQFFLVFGSLGLAGMGASLAINACRTLKSLYFSIPLGDDYDPLCGVSHHLSHELRFIAGNNILETLQLYVGLEEDVSFPTEYEDWSAFDSVLTESGAFPMLHRVLVEMELDDLNAECDVQRLKEDKFPRLVESKTVEFDFYATVD
jgi:hypothetical protein